MIKFSIGDRVSYRVNPNYPRFPGVVIGGLKGRPITDGESIYRVRFDNGGSVCDLPVEYLRDERRPL